MREDANVCRLRRDQMAPTTPESFWRKRQDSSRNAKSLRMTKKALRLSNLPFETSKQLRKSDFSS